MPGRFYLRTTPIDNSGNDDSKRTLQLVIRELCGMVLAVVVGLYRTRGSGLPTSFRFPYNYLEGEYLSMLMSAYSA